VPVPIYLTFVFIGAGDFHRDEDVDGTDLYLLTLRYGEVDCDGCPEDINCDNNVDKTDLEILAGNFGM
jgi:hypothetical protein